MSIFKRAWKDTQAKHSWFSQFFIALLAALLCWKFLPKEQAMGEITAIIIAVAAALIIWPILEYVWHLICAPYRIVRDKNKELQLQLDQLSMPSKKITYGREIDLRYTALPKDIERAMAQEPNTPIWQAVDYISRVINDDEVMRKETRKQLRIAASNGDIKIKGLKQINTKTDYRNDAAYSDLYSDIPLEYWTTHEINLFANNRENRKEYHTSPLRIDGKDIILHGKDHYRDLLIYLPAIKNKWIDGEGAFNLVDDQVRLEREIRQLKLLNPQSPSEIESQKNK